mgnify:FL=1
MTSENRQAGMDNPYYDWSPLISRSKLTWPNDSNIALCVILTLERYQWEHLSESIKSPSQPGGAAETGRPFPDIIGFPYGNMANV